MQLNNGGDTIGLWSEFAAYDGDHETHANAVLSLTYTDDPDFPDSNNSASITLNNLGADPANGLSWDLSFLGDGVGGGDGSFNPGPVGDTSDFHPGGDIGSPGVFEVQPIGGRALLSIQQNDPSMIATWQQQYGTVPALPAVAAVPEPLSTVLLAAACCLLAGTGRISRAR